jgi:hypothetical protein
MACIPALIELKERNGGALFIGNAYLESGGTYRGYHYCVTLVALMANRCGYVAVQPSHPAYRSDAIQNVRVHRGLELTEMPESFAKFLKENAIAPCGDQWLGFSSTIPFFDLPDTDAVKRIFPVGTYCMLDEPRLNIMQYAEPGASLKDTKYMEDQCKQLIDQLIVMEKIYGKHEARV